MECPQYSTRLEALAYLYVSSNTMSPALRPTSVPSGILIHAAVDDNRHGPKSVGTAVPWLRTSNCTVINWIVITDPNPNRNRSPNPVLTVQISTIQISPGEFHCPEFDCPHIVRIPLHIRKCLHVGNRTYNSSHCMSGIQRAGRKNITSGTRRGVRNIKRREVSFFCPQKT